MDVTTELTGLTPNEIMDEVVHGLGCAFLERATAMRAPVTLFAGCLPIQLHDGPGPSGTDGSIHAYIVYFTNPCKSIPLSPLGICLGIKVDPGRRAFDLQVIPEQSERSGEQLFTLRVRE